MNIGFWGPQEEDETADGEGRKWESWAGGTHNLHGYPLTLAVSERRLEGNVTANGYGVSFCNVEKVLELDSSVGCTTKRI